MIAKTNFGRACNVARRAAGGVRGYPFLLGLKYRLQLPVLHCTGNLSKMVLLFILACLPAEVSASAKRNILAMTSKGKVESLYLRKYREVVVSAVACPSMLSQDLDPVFMSMLQLVQLINAGWRSSLTDADSAERVASAAIVRLYASKLGPQFRQVKPMDPETKFTKVINLYLHAPIAHLHHQVGDDRAAVAYVSEDNMEGHIRGLGRFAHNNGNNASQAALFSDLVGVNAATINFSTPWSHPSSLIFTKYIRVCKCWAKLRKLGPADVGALHNIAGEEEYLAVMNNSTPDDFGVQLPVHARADANGAPRCDARGRLALGKKESVRRGLRFGQHTIVACFCGKLSGVSDVMELLQQRQAAAAAAAARVASAASAAPGNGATGAAAISFPTGDAPEESHGESDRGYATNDGHGSSAGESSRDDGDGHATGRRKSKQRAVAETASAMAAVAPPLWLLRRIFDDPAMYGTVSDRIPATQDTSSAAGMVACARKHIYVMELF